MTGKLFITLQFCLLSLVNGLYYSGYAVDFNGAATEDEMQCLRDGNYTAIYLRIYYDNSFDTTVVDTIKNARQAGIGIELKFIPNILEGISARTQIEDLRNSLDSRGIQISRLWVEVRDPRQWLAAPFDVPQNIAFFNETIYAMKNNSWYPAVVTTKDEWMTITGNWNDNSFYYMKPNLWYLNTTGDGVSGESPADFSDFVNFGVWSTSSNMPSMKTFATKETVCGLTVNRDFYYIDSATSFSKIGSVDIVDEGRFANAVREAKKFKAAAVKTRTHNFNAILKTPKA